MYKIKWVHKHSGLEGEGKPVFKTYELADHAANYANLLCPEITHWAVYCEETENGQVS